MFTVRRQPGPCGGATSFDVAGSGPFEAVNQVSALSPHWSRGGMLGAQPVVYFTNDSRGTAWWHVWRKEAP